MPPSYTESKVFTPLIDAFVDSTIPCRTVWISRCLVRRATGYKYNKYNTQHFYSAAYTYSDPAYDMHRNWKKNRQKSDIFLHEIPFSLDSLGLEFIAC